MTATKADYSEFNKEQVLENLSMMAEEGLLTPEPLPFSERLRLAVPYDEEEIDRRLGVLERAGVDPEVLEELRAFHASRRKWQGVGNEA